MRDGAKVVSVRVAVKGIRLTVTSTVGADEERAIEIVGGITANRTEGAKEVSARFLVPGIVLIC